MLRGLKQRKEKFKAIKRLLDVIRKIIRGQWAVNIFRPEKKLSISKLTRVLPPP